MPIFVKINFLPNFISIRFETTNEGFSEVAKQEQKQRQEEQEEEEEEDDDDDDDEWRYDCHDALTS